MDGIFDGSTCTSLFLYLFFFPFQFNKFFWERDFVGLVTFLNTLNLSTCSKPQLHPLPGGSTTGSQHKTWIKMVETDMELVFVAGIRNGWRMLRTFLLRIVLKNAVKSFGSYQSYSTSWKIMSSKTWTEFLGTNLTYPRWMLLQSK